MRTLIVVDAQKDFVTGVLGSKEAKEAVVKIKERIELYRKAGFRIMFTQDLHDEHYLDTQEGQNLPIPHCIKGTNGSKLVAGLRKPGDKVIKKSGFGSDKWKKYFKVEDQHGTSIELVGFCTDICVVTNALLLKTLLPEAKITVNPECCAGVTPEKHEAALKVLESCQIYPVKY